MEIQNIPFEGNTVQVFTDDKNNPWWVAADVCKILGLSNPTKALTTIPPKNKLTSEIVRAGQKRAVNLINEPGLYRLIAKSQKAEAIRFQDWVFEIVLPHIRKTGSYLPANPKQQALLLAEQLIESNKHNKQLEAKIEEDKPKVEYVEKAVASDRLTPLGKWGMVIGVGRNKIFDILEEKDFLTWGYNNRIPYTKYQEKGKNWLVIKTSKHNPNWEQVYITEKGKVAIYSHLVATEVVEVKNKQLKLF